ncbi:thioesterase domain-containing protein [Streptomyces sp. NBC_00846]|uniref:thioesterase II family protein n=1 Tax=Streptomyces sp. NBC_00846 TaxID=2975849 RepID=UPI0038653764|nr:thioesterase domain-containing protein [Streptomyces sp. NBC_00846]
MSTVVAPAEASRAGRPAGAWFPFAEHPGSDGPLLYCLPHAGGSASVFRSWFGRIGSASVRPVQLPGRETRLQEVPYDAMDLLVPDLAEAVLADLAAGRPGRPFAVYGHSLGATIAFELVREIRRRQGPDPVHLIVSGCPAPGGGWATEGEDDPRMTGASDDEVVALLRRIGGTPEWMLTDPSVLRLILPPFRADFTVKESYRYRAEPPLTVPVTALAANGDPRGPASGMAEWKRGTTGPSTLHTLSGGHFAVLAQAEITHRHIERALRSAV